ncbi:MAG: prepilin peptidase [Candidatus Margulisbacteria bacterium]|nr:prepilin peptidase [Candidatus Margulisiibacteriota bacterium]
MSDIYIVISLITAGSILGSFSNMLIYRLPRDEDIVFKRSHCPDCAHILGFWQLIPILSYVYQMGKCVYCKKRISLRYLLVEVGTIGIFLITWVMFGLTPYAFQMGVMLWALHILAWTDIETGLLPNTLTYPLLGLNVIMALYFQRLPDAVYGAVVGYLIFWIIGVIGKWVYKKEAMGGGDMKLSAAIGAAFGVKLILLSTYISFMIGGGMALGFIVCKRKNIADTLPLGPAIILAAVISLFWGQKIFGWYFGP